MNLVTNAVDSMANKSGSRILSIASETRDDGQVVITVADTGTGIVAEDIDRIFNPFFTTKSGGMGMGLSICRSIVQAHRGELTVAPNSPEGTRFQVVFSPDD